MSKALGRLHRYSACNDHSMIVCLMRQVAGLDVTHQFVLNLVLRYSVHWDMMHASMAKIPAEIRMIRNGPSGRLRHNALPSWPF